MSFEIALVTGFALVAAVPVLCLGCQSSSSAEKKDLELTDEECKVKAEEFKAKAQSHQKISGQYTKHSRYLALVSSLQTENEEKIGRLAKDLDEAIKNKKKIKKAQQQLLRMNPKGEFFENAFEKVRQIIEPIASARFSRPTTSNIARPHSGALSSDFKTPYDWSDDYIELDLSNAPEPFTSSSNPQDQLEAVFKFLRYCRYDETIGNVERADWKGNKDHYLKEALKMYTPEEQANIKRGLFDNRQTRSFLPIEEIERQEDLSGLSRRNFGSRVAHP